MVCIIADPASQTSVSLTAGDAFFIDLADGGSSHFAETIRKLKQK